MRVYRVTLLLDGDIKPRPGRKPIYFVSQVEEHQRADDAMHQAMMNHPGWVAHHCKLLYRGTPEDWAATSHGTVQ